MDPKEKQKLKDMVADGRFFSVEFTKRTTGTPRRMLARTGVRVGTAGVGQMFDPDDYDLLLVYDVHKRAYRHIPLDSIHWLRAHGRLYRPRTARVAHGRAA